MTIPALLLLVAGIFPPLNIHAQETATSPKSVEQKHNKKNQDKKKPQLTDADKRKLAEAKRKAEAEAKVDEAVNLSGEIIAAAEADAKDRSEEILGQARTTLDQLIETETQTRQNLNHSHEAIGTALDLPEIADLSSGLDARDDDDSDDDDDDDDS